MATEGQWPLVPEVPLQGATAARTPCRSLLHMQETDGETEAPMGEDLTDGHTEGHWLGNQHRARSPAPQPWTLQTSRGHHPRTHSQGHTGLHGQFSHLHPPERPQALLKVPTKPCSLGPSACAPTESEEISQIWMPWK